MKLFSKISLLAIFIIGLSSCSKTYTCNCTAGGAISDQSYELKESSEANAKSTCDGYAANTGGQVTCTLE